MAIAPVNKVTPQFVEQLNDNFSAIDTAIDALQALPSGGDLLATNNLSDVSNPTAAVANLGAAAAVANVTAQAALTETPKVIDLQGYDALGDGGGGRLVHDPISSATVDNGLVFPAITGRYTRPVDGILHSKWFGLKDSTSLDQTVALQKFLYVLGEPLTGGKSFRGMVDPGVIDCAGATIYATRDGSSNGLYSNAMSLTGANRRNCVIKNLTMVAGTPRWKQFTASGNVLLENFRIEGRLHLQNIEGNSVVRGVTVARAALDTQVSPLVSDLPTTLLGTTAAGVPGDPATGVTWATWASDYMVTLFASNHPLIENLSIAGKAGSGIPSGDYRRGFFMYGNANARVFQGTIYGCNDAVVIDAGLSIRNYLDGLKFEECEATHIWVRGGSDNIISTWHRLGAGHGLTAPLIRLGETGVSTATNTRIEKAYLFSDQAASGTAIKGERVAGVKIDDNRFVGFATAIDTGQSSVTIGAARLLADIEISKKNKFESCTTNVSRGARSQRNDTADLTPWPVVNSATTVWSGYNGLVQTLSTNASRTINVGEMAVGQTYTLYIKKGNIAHTITWAGDALTWVGETAPAFAAMAITEHAEVKVRAVDLGAGPILSASFEIRGNASIATKFLRGDGTWQTIAGGGDALTSNPLSQFAATTSAQLAGVISDETGSGALVFATSPTLVTPVLGVATATSVAADVHTVTANNINAQTGTTYTLVAADNGKTIRCTNAAAITVSLNTGLPAGFWCNIVQNGAGQVTVGGTATKNSANGLKTRAQYSVITILYSGTTDTYFVGGDTAI